MVDQWINNTISVVTVEKLIPGENQGNRMNQFRKIESIVRKMGGSFSTDPYRNHYK